MPDFEDIEATQFWIHMNFQFLALHCFSSWRNDSIIDLKPLFSLSLSRMEVKLSRFFFFFFHKQRHIVFLLPLDWCPARNRRGCGREGGSLPGRRSKERHWCSQSSGPGSQGCVCGETHHMGLGFPGIWRRKWENTIKSFNGETEPSQFTQYFNTFYLLREKKVFKMSLRSWKKNSGWPWLSVVSPRAPWCYVTTTQPQTKLNWRKKLFELMVSETFSPSPWGKHCEARGRNWTRG